MPTSHFGASEFDFWLFSDPVDWPCMPWEAVGGGPGTQVPTDPVGSDAVPGSCLWPDAAMDGVGIREVNQHKEDFSLSSFRRFPISNWKKKLN